MSYEFFYEGSPYSLDPNYGDSFIGYKSPLKSLSMTTDARTANQIQEVSNKLNLGGKSFEVSFASPEIFESTPKQQLTEINRLTKLTGADTSVHAPIVEPSGITKQGYSEESRHSVERQIQLAVDRSHELNPNGNIPVVFHSSAGIPGAQYGFEEKEGKREEVKVQMAIINQESNQIHGVERDVKYYPEHGGKKVIRDVKSELRAMNDTEWINSVTNLAFYKKESDETLKKAHAALLPLVAMKNQGKEINFKNMTPEQHQAFNELGKAELFLDNVTSSFRSLYNKAYKYSSGEHVKEFLEKEVAKPWVELRNQEEEMMKNHKKLDLLDQFDMVIKRSEVMDETLSKLRALEHHAPQVYRDIEEFAAEKAAKTFGNVAFNAYEKFGDSTPIIAIENPPAGMGLSRAEDLKKIIEESRKQFVNKAVEKGMGESEAKSAAKKIIGATWDLGHINMLRRYGFEDKDIIKETEKIAPDVKHVHLSDNFGFEHTELPMGMGNVPTKEMLEKLEKQGFKGKKVIEAISWWQHFKTPPFVPTLEAFGSPLYAMQMQPAWNQSAYSMGHYFSGYGPIFPEQHFSMYGSGFSGMPVELGGQMAGKQSRFSGAPSE